MPCFNTTFSQKVNNDTTLDFLVTLSKSLICSVCYLCRWTMGDEKTISFLKSKCLAQRYDIWRDGCELISSVALRVT